jgi:hypothetical protein
MPTMLVNEAPRLPSHGNGHTIASGPASYLPSRTREELVRGRSGLEGALPRASKPARYRV